MASTRSVVKWRELFTDHPRVSIWTYAYRAVDIFDAHQYALNDLVVCVDARRRASSTCSNTHQIGTAHARICTCCMILWSRVHLCHFKARSQRTRMHLAMRNLLPGAMLTDRWIFLMRTNTHHNKHCKIVRHKSGNTHMGGCCWYW